MAHAARGMFTFTATEKDCVDAEGEEEECIICFEEYEAGDKMARLVCLCKFHEVRRCFSILCYWERIMVANLFGRNALGSGGERKEGARVRRINYMSRGELNSEGDGRLGKAFWFGMALAYTPFLHFYKWNNTLRALHQLRFRQHSCAPFLRS